MLTWDATWFVNLAGVMWGAAEIGAVALAVAVLTFGEWLAIFHIVVISTAPCVVKGVVAGTIGPRVVEVVVGVVDLVVGHVGKGGHAVNNPGSNAVVRIGVSEGLDAFKALFCDVFKVRS